MSPELFLPERFGLKDSRQTKRSDCYALGMVIYEVLSGQAPFPQCTRYAAVLRALMGERPERPQGVEGKLFADDIWNVLGRCWEPKPDDRPSIGYVLQCLEEVSKIWTPPSPCVVASPPTTDLLMCYSSGSSNEESTDES